MNRLMIFIIIGILLGGCDGQTPTPITHVYAFGDDLFDNGKCVIALQEVVDTEPFLQGFMTGFENNWEGRMTNGPVMVEVLADRLNAPLTDYAICGALSWEGNILGGLPAFESTGLLAQIAKFEAELNGKKADPGALYAIQIGGNDFFEDNYASAANLVLANIDTAVRQLAGLGAKHIMVGNAPNFSKFPGFITVAKEAEAFQAAMNDTLAGEMAKLSQELNADIEVFDFAATEEKIQNSPGEYGITNLTEPCTQMGSESGISAICDKPDEYYFWGLFYLSGRAHEILGEAMAEQVRK